MPRVSIKARMLRDEKFKDGLHWCSTCKTFLPIDEFSRSRNRPYGLWYSCKSCEKTKLKHRNEGKRNGTYWGTETHRQRKKEAILLIGNCCQRCGYDEFSASLSFHHVDPENKELNHLGFSRRSDSILGELDKCVLLCHNCHFSFHAGEWSAEFVKRDGLGWTIKQYTISRITN